MFVAELAIPGHHVACSAPSCQAVYVHDEECHVEEHIADPIVVIEREAVENARSIIQTGDVVGEEVSMTIAHHAARDALVEEPSPTPQVGPSEVSHQLEVIRVDQGSNLLANRDEVVLPVRRYRLGRCHGRRSNRRQRRMEDGHLASNCPKATAEPFVIDKCREPPVIGQATHDDHVVDKVITLPDVESPR